MDNYLKPQSYYEDLYDLITIKDCLRHLQYFQPAKPSKKKTSPVVKTRGIALKMIGDVSIYYLKGNRYKEKVKTINERMRRDEELDKLVDSVAPSNSLSCRDCYTVLEFTGKHIHDSISDKPSVMLWYECSKCNKRSAKIFEIYGFAS